MNRLRLSLILARCLFHMLRGATIIHWRFPRLSPAQRGERVHEWAGQLMRILGIELRVHGTPPTQGPVLLVANHVSWLDITAMHAAGYCRFIAKADIHGWPLVGTLATGAGTLYIERTNRRDALRVVHHMSEALQAGDVLAVFPEGTTSDGTDVLPFHANLLQAALATGTQALPVGIRYVDADTGALSAAPAYIGDDSLVDSLWRTLRAPRLRVELHYGAPLSAPPDTDRRAWAATLRDAVQALRTP